jgi:glycosyltransferase involved in cell wall biosynthesis
MLADKVSYCYDFLLRGDTVEQRTDRSRADTELWIVVPAYNEEPQIAATVGLLREHLPGVIVVDDGSTDSTAREAKRAGALVVRHAINLGQGAALLTGIKLALLKGAEQIVTFDADGQHQPGDIDVLLRVQRSSGADVVVGSRFLGSATGMPLSRHLLLRAATAYTRLTTGLALTDAHNGLRLLSRKAAERLRLRQDRMAHASEISEWLGQSGLKVAEAPVRIRYTSYSLAKGQNFFSSFNIIWDLWSSRLHR